MTEVFDIWFRHKDIQKITSEAFKKKVEERIKAGGAIITDPLSAIIAVAKEENIPVFQGDPWSEEESSLVDKVLEVEEEPASPQEILEQTPKKKRWPKAGFTVDQPPLIPKIREAYQKKELFSTIRQPKQWTNYLNQFKQGKAINLWIYQGHPNKDQLFALGRVTNIVGLRILSREIELTFYGVDRKITANQQALEKIARRGGFDSWELLFATLELFYKEDLYQQDFFWVSFQVLLLVKELAEE